MWNGNYLSGVSWEWHVCCLLDRRDMVSSTKSHRSAPSKEATVLNAAEKTASIHSLPVNS